MEADTVALEFVSAINRRRPERMAELMTDDHAFVDSDGKRLSGRETVQEAWLGYFEIMPEYEIQVHEIYSRDSTVVLVGTARGICGRGGRLQPRSWSVPAAWRVVTRDAQVAEWQIFVNPEPILRSMRHLEQDPD